MATSKERLDGVITALKSSGFVCNRETAGVAVMKLVAYRSAAEQGIGSVALLLKSGDMEGAAREMNILLYNLDCVER